MEFFEMLSLTNEQTFCYNCGNICETFSECGCCVHSHCFECICDNCGLETYLITDE